MLVQSQCYCQFLVGSTREPFKNRLLFHRLESHTEPGVTSLNTFHVRFTSAAVTAPNTTDLFEVQSAPRRPIGTQHTKAPRERSKSIKSRQLSSPLPRHPRCLAPNGPRSADPSRTSLNKLSTMADVVLLLTFMALRIYIGIQNTAKSNVSVFSCYFKYGGPQFLSSCGHGNPAPAPDASGSSF